jgi:hypothetical protein
MDAQVQGEGIGGTFLTNVVSYFIVSEVKIHPPSKLVENHLLPLDGLHKSPGLSPVESEAVHSPIPAPDTGFHIRESSIH